VTIQAENEISAPNDGGRQHSGVPRTFWRRVQEQILDLDPDDSPRQAKRRLTSVSSWMGLLFISAAIVSNIIFDWVPTLDGFVRSFFTWTNRNPELVFVGLDNFRRVLTDPEFHLAVGNMLFFLVAALVLMLPSILTAVVLFRIRGARLQYLYRVLLVLPMVVPALVFTLLWIFILGYDFGAINSLLVDLGFGRVAFLGDPALIKWTILLTGIPFVTANTVLIYLGGIQAVGDDVWDAAKLDGVGPIRKFFELEFPLILGQFRLIIIGVIGTAITTYATQLVFYNPSVHGGIITPGLLMYFKAFPNTGAPDYGYAYALGLILFIVALSLSLTALKFLKNRD
jgi:raffinose/stachyose/melibiose transport system permease protein